MANKSLLALAIAIYNLVGSNLTSQADVAPPYFSILTRPYADSPKVQLVSEDVKIFVGKTQCRIVALYEIKNYGKKTTANISLPARSAWSADDPELKVIVDGQPVKNIAPIPPEWLPWQGPYTAYSSARSRGWPVTFAAGQRIHLQVTSKESTGSRREGWHSYHQRGDGWARSDAERRLAKPVEAFVDYRTDKRLPAISAKTKMAKAPNCPRHFTFIMEDGLTTDNVLDTTPKTHVVSNVLLTADATNKSVDGVNMTYLIDTSKTQVIAAYKKMVRKYPSNPEVIEELGEWHRQQGHAERQLKLYADYLLSKRPKHIPAPIDPIYTMFRAWVDNTESTHNQVTARRLAPYFKPLYADPKDTSEDGKRATAWFKKYS